MHRTGSSLQSSPIPSTIGNAEPYYSNEDIALLHHIVILAQELLPKLPIRERLPTNALFSAYYDILPRLGVNSDHDSRYARVLFKIGGLRGNGSLYDKFEAVLSRMGIEIEFDQAGKENESQTDVADGSPDDIISAKMQEEPVQGRRRRTSDTPYEHHRQGAPPTQRRRSRSVSMGRRIPSAPRSVSCLPGLSLAPEDSRSSTYEYGAWTTKIQPRRSDEARLKLQSDVRDRERARSTSSHGGVRIHRRPLRSVDDQQRLRNAVPYSSDYQGELTAVTSMLEHNRIIGSPQSMYTTSKSGGSDGILQDKASLFLERILTFLCKRKIQIWREKATASKLRKFQLEIIAINHDHYVLLHQALQSWYACLGMKRQALEMEDFFAHLERRSGRARDIYLLHKAFTHWVNRADDRVQGTLLARRHIVRTRVFNAWREITAVNELKVRRHVIDHHFAIWRYRYATTATIHDLALQKHIVSVLKRFYSCWFQKLKEVRATALWRDTTQRHTMSRWIVTICTTKHAGEVAAHSYQWHGRRSALSHWKVRAEYLVSQEQDANAFRRSYLGAGILKKWLHETRIIPARNAFRTEVLARLLRETFTTWTHRTKQARQAFAIDRSRILREAVTSWRHRIRAKILRDHVNARIAAESVYTWALKERHVVGDRLLTHKILIFYLNIWIQKSRGLQEARLARELVIQSFTTQKLQTGYIQHWWASLERRRQLEAAASAFRNPKLELGTMTYWLKNLQHFWLLQNWALDAEFYFLAVKCMKRWEGSLEIAKREKRRVAYVQVRRLRKNNTARTVLSIWRSKARHVLELDGQALGISRRKSIGLGVKIFNRWRNRYKELSVLHSVEHDWFLRKHFTFWERRSTAFQLVEFETTTNFEERLLRRLLKRWSLTGLQQRNKDRNAIGLHEVKTRRACRKMFIYWRQKTAIARPVEDMRLSEQPQVSNHIRSTAGFDASSDLGGNFAGLQWAGSLRENTTASIPGYLSTPSKSERVMAAAERFSSTTPRATLSTPFERQLRAQYSGRLLRASQRAGKSSYLNATSGLAGFADIIESEHINSEHNVGN